MSLWQHHPDCDYWLDYYPWECICGLTTQRPPWSRLEKWTMAQWREWVEGVTRKAEAIDLESMQD